MIDTDGRFAVPMVFGYIQTCSGGVIAAWDEANGWNLLNKVKCQHDYIPPEGSLEILFNENRAGANEKQVSDFETRLKANR